MQFLQNQAYLVSLFTGLICRIVQRSEKFTHTMFMLVMLKKTMQCLQNGQEMIEMSKTENERPLVTKFVPRPSGSSAG